MLSLLLQLLRRTRIHARRWRRQRWRPHHVDVHGDRTATSEPPPAPLEKGARGGRDGARGQLVEQTEKETRGDRTTKCSRLCVAAAASGDGGGPWFWLPCRQFQRSNVCVDWGKALVVRDRGRRARGQGARFAGRLCIRWGFAGRAGAKLKIDVKRSLVRKNGDPLQPSFIHSQLRPEMLTGNRTWTAKTNEEREESMPTRRGGRIDQKEKRLAGSPRFHTGQATRDSDSNSVFRNNNHVPTIHPPSLPPPDLQYSPDQTA